MPMEKLTGKISHYAQSKTKNAEILNLERLSRKYDENNIPLYLSYPTSSFWKSNTGSAAFTEKFDQEALPFLYFHFPYCRKGCFYCMCYKHVSQDPSDNDAYLALLGKEIETKISLLGRDHFKGVRQMHWGGGTPTYLTCRQIDTIFNTLLAHVSFDSGDNTTLSIEGYPDDEIITKEKLRLLKSLGFDEISYGVQDFDKRVQKAINRNHEKRVVRKLIEDAKETGFKVNVDLCYGLPFQGINELESTVTDIIAMDPDRVAMFTYVHHPMLFPMQKAIPAASIPNSFLRVLMAENAEKRFEAAGYRKVGYDHFVKETHPLYQSAVSSGIIRDFMGYSAEDRKQFIGFGNSAISSFGGNFFHNQTSLKAYQEDVNAGRLPLIENMSHEMTLDDLIRNEIIQQHIMCDFKINKEEISQKYKIQFDDYFKAEMETLTDYKRDGLVEFLDSGEIKINKTGEKFIRHIAYAFDSYYGADRSAS